MTVAVMVLLWTAGTTVSAQELEPRAYRVLPTGLHFAVMTYQFSSGNVLGDPTSPLQDLDVDAHTFIASYLGSFGLFGRSASITVSVPYAFLSGSASFAGELIADSRSGAVDSRARLAVNLIGGPAMTPQEFASFRRGRSLGVSVTVQAPTGQYDPTRLVNFGSNRWAFKPEIGYASFRGRWVFEAALGVWLFTDNPDFFGGGTRSQDPIGNLQGHVTYNFQNGIWLAASVNYFTGGRTSIDGVDANDLQRNSRIGLALSVPLGGPHSMKFAANSGAYTSAGADFDVGSITYQYRW
jgi:hypothetical protein